MKDTSAHTRRAVLRPTTHPHDGPTPSDGPEQGGPAGRSGMHAHRLLPRLTGRPQQDPTPPAPRPAPPAPTTAPAVTAAHDGTATRPLSAGLERCTTAPRQPADHPVARVTARLRAGFDEAMARPDRGDISITTVIIWVAAVTGALLIAGTIAVVIGKYNGQLNGL